MHRSLDRRRWRHLLIPPPERRPSAAVLSGKNADAKRRLCEASGGEDDGDTRAATSGASPAWSGPDGSRDALLEALAYPSPRKAAFGRRLIGEERRREASAMRSERRGGGRRPRKAGGARGGALFICLAAATPSTSAPH